MNDFLFEWSERQSESVIYFPRIATEFENMSTAINMPSRISKADPRYKLLESIPMKEFEDDHSYLYLSINCEKDYYIVSIDATIQTQLLWYSPNDDDNRVVRLWAHRHIIPTPQTHYESDYSVYDYEDEDEDEEDEYYEYEESEDDDRRQ